MTLSLYDVTVGTFQQMLTGLSGVVDKGLAHCRDSNIAPDDLLEARLFPDMAPFRFQIQSVVHHSKGALEAIRTGEFRPRLPRDNPDYPALQRLITDVRVALGAIGRDDVDGYARNDIMFRSGDVAIPFTVQEFLLSFSLPNFYFHVTTAYDVLRSKGVAIGKRDYLGPLKVKAEMTQTNYQR